MATLVAIGGPATDRSLLEDKQQKLFSVLNDLRHVIVAYSGGTDWDWRLGYNRDW